LYQIVCMIQTEKNNKRLFSKSAGKENGFALKYFLVIITFAFVANVGHAQYKPTATTLTGEAADRLAIKELVDAYAHDADRREAEKQANLFTIDGVLKNYDGEPGKYKPKSELRGRAALKAGFDFLKKFDVTMHFNGQSDIYLSGDSATGETYCLAHQIWVEDGKRVLLIIGLRYYDTFARVDGKWLFAERKLIYDWIDKKPSVSGTF
jgi:hypothetical protein